MFEQVFRILLVSICILGLSKAGTYGQLKIMPLGNSITYDNKIGDSRPIQDRIAYRKKLHQLLTGAGYDFDFVGSENAGEPNVPDGDNAGFPGITAGELENLLETGIINQSLVAPPNHTNGDAVTSGPYLDAFNPDCILLHIGTNGVASTTASDIEDILDEVDAYEARSGKTIPVFLARIIREVPNNSATQTLNNAVETMVDSRIGSGDNIIKVNMETGASIIYSLSPVGDMVDKLHPAQAGYDKMADLWFTKLDEYYKTPNINSVAPLSVSDGQVYSYDVNATGVPTPTYTFNTPQPSGMTINETSGLIQWTPSLEQVGTHNIQVKAINAKGNDIQSFTINVSQSNRPPSFTKGDDLSVAINSGTHLFEVWATDIDDGDTGINQELTFNVTNNKPEAFVKEPTINSDGDLSFEIEPGILRVIEVTVTLQDDGGGNDESEPQTFTITIEEITGINKENISSSMNVFPNPSIGSTLKLKLDNKVTGDLSVRIMDLSGKLCYSKELSKNTSIAEYALDVGKLSKGIYILKLMSKEYIGESKIIRN